MQRSLIPFAALLFVACPGGGLDKPVGETGYKVEDCDVLQAEWEEADGTYKTQYDAYVAGTLTEEELVEFETLLAEALDAYASACGDEDGDGYTTSTGDCDDADTSISPAALEICDGIDNNCDGQVDEDATTTFFPDLDGDGFGAAGTGTEACEQPADHVGNDDDCDDTVAGIYPGATEVCDGADNDCDGEKDEGVTTTYYADADGDEYGSAGSPLAACEKPADYVLDNTDCDDTTHKAFPGNREVCDEIDNDCNGRTDEGVTTEYYADRDGDNYGDANMTADACSLPSGYANTSDDCDDRDGAVNPGATEVCNGIDDDCNGDIDEDTAADASTWYADMDVDTYGDDDVSVVSCYPPTDYVGDAGDCDDNRALTNPGATEYCNSIDDDCDDEIDEGSSIDAATWYADDDGDSYGDDADTVNSCTQPTDYVDVGGDCDDRDATSYPGGTEVCDGADNDCNGTIDDGASNGITYYADNDSDEFGDPNNTSLGCEQPRGYVENDYDCDDLEVGEPVVADALLGSSSGTGSASDPFNSLQAAIDQSNSCVIAMQGTYDETVNLGEKGLDVRGVDGSGSTTIDAGLSTCTSANPDECEAVVTIASGSGAAPVLRGFTITGGTGATSYASASQDCADSSPSNSGSNTCTVTTYTYCGGGIFVDGDNPTLDDLVVTENTLPAFAQTSTGDYTQTWTYSHGGGICVASGSVDADYVWIHKNWADEGGGLYIGETGAVTLQHGMVAENGASDGGGVSVAGGTLSATNAIITCNDASTDGGGVFGETNATVTLTNVAMYGNLSSTSGTSRGADVWMPAVSTTTIVNSIVENNVAVSLLYGSGTGRLEYNNVYNADASGSSYGGGWSAGIGSMSSGSNFVGADCDGVPTNDDWSLSSTSIAIDSGNPATVYRDTDGTNNDAGPYGGPGGDW